MPKLGRKVSVGIAIMTLAAQSSTKCQNEKGRLDERNLHAFNKKKSVFS